MIGEEGMFLPLCVCVCVYLLPLFKNSGEIEY